MKKRFIFDENYIKRYAKQDKFKLLVIGASVLVLILIIIIVLLATRRSERSVIRPKQSFELKEQLVLEAGSELPEVIDYFTKLENIDVNSIKVIYPDDFEISYDTSKCSEEDLEKINDVEHYDADDFKCIVKTLKTTEEYGITLVILNKEYTVNVIVKDTVPPELALKAVEIYEGDSYSLDDFVINCADASGECKLSFYEGDMDGEGNPIDYSSFKESGVYNIVIKAVDINGNKVNTDTTLTIKRVEAPLYTITFDSDGGSEVGSLVVPEGSSATEPEVPTKNGYTFAGWYLGNNKYDFATAVDRNISLKAKWNANQSGGGGSTNPPVLTVTRVALNYQKIYLKIGDAKVVTAYIYPSSIKNKTVTWSSGNNNIATVDNGKITGIGAGVTTITATVDGKSASVEVEVRGDAGDATCTYGDTNYNKQYILSVSLINNGCAVDPNRQYNDVSTAVGRDYQKLVNELTNRGFSMQANYFEYREAYANVKNTSGKGLVGVQITISVNVIDPSSPYAIMSAEYIINPDGSRKILKNTIMKDGRQVSL